MECLTSYSLREKWSDKKRRLSVLVPAALLVLGVGVRAQCGPLLGGGCGLLPPICSSAPQAGNANFSIIQPRCPGALTTGPFGLLGLCSSAPIVFGPPTTCSACSLFVNPILLVFPGPWDYRIPIPGDPALIGATVCVQSACFFGGGGCWGLSDARPITII